MEILILAPSLPLPPTDGGKIRVLNLLRQTARAHRVTLLALETERTDADAAQALGAEGIEVVLVRQETPRVPAITLRSLRRALTQKWPLTVAKYELPAFARAVRDQLVRRRFDVVHFEMMHMVPYLRLVRGHSDAALLLSTQNVDSDVWHRAAAHQPGRLRRFAFRWQAGVFERAERHFGSHFNGVTAASERDADLYRRMLPTVPVEVIDNGVDLDAYRPKPEAEDTATFVYTGSYDWLPNADAVVFFCTEIWPHIRSAMPEARFFAVGKEPTPAMRAFDGRDGISVTGRVPEIHPYIERASAYVVPLRIGGGTRLKILEAMGSGKAIVSTSIGCEALDIVPGRDLWVADDPKAFAEAAVRLAADVSARRELGRAARQRVEARYGWESIGRRLNAFYEAIAADPAGRRSI